MEPVHLQLNDRDYAPSMEEKRSAREHLLRYGLAPSNNAVRELLGVSAVRTEVSKRTRWNPRDPNSKLPD